MSNNVTLGDFHHVSSLDAETYTTVMSAERKAKAYFDGADKNKKVRKNSNNRKSKLMGSLDISMVEGSFKHSGGAKDLSERSIQNIYLRKQNDELKGLKLRQGDGFEQKNGIFVSFVGIGSRAEIQGLRVGDEILAVNDIDVTNQSVAFVDLLISIAQFIVLSFKKPDVTDVYGRRLSSQSEIDITFNDTKPAPQDAVEDDLISSDADSSSSDEDDENDTPVFVQASRTGVPANNDGKPTKINTRHSKKQSSPSSYPQKGSPPSNKASSQKQGQPNRSANGTRKSNEMSRESSVGKDSAALTKLISTNLPLKYSDSETESDLDPSSSDPMTIANTIVNGFSPNRAKLETFRIKNKKSTDSIRRVRFANNTKAGSESPSSKRRPKSALKKSKGASNSQFSQQQLPNSSNQQRSAPKILAPKQSQPNIVLPQKKASNNLPDTSNIESPSAIQHNTDSTALVSHNNEVHEVQLRKKSPQQLPNQPSQNYPTQEQKYDGVNVQQQQQQQQQQQPQPSSPSDVPRVGNIQDVLNSPHMFAPSQQQRPHSFEFGQFSSSQQQSRHALREGMNVQQLPNSQSQPFFNPESRQRSYSNSQTRYESMTNSPMDSSSFSSSSNASKYLYNGLYQQKLFEPSRNTSQTPSQLDLLRQAEQNFRANSPRTLQEQGVHVRRASSPQHVAFESDDILTVSRGRDLPPTHGCVYTVTLKRNMMHGLGLHIVGGVDTSFGALFVSHVVPGGPATDVGTISVGDRFLAVQHLDTHNMTQEEFKNEVKAAGMMVSLRFMQVGANQWKSICLQAGVSEQDFHDGRFTNHSPTGSFPISPVRPSSFSFDHAGSSSLQRQNQYNYNPGTTHLSTFPDEASFREKLLKLSKLKEEENYLLEHEEDFDGGMVSKNAPPFSTRSQKNPQGRMMLNRSATDTYTGGSRFLSGVNKVETKLLSQPPLKGPPRRNYSDSSAVAKHPLDDLVYSYSSAEQVNKQPRRRSSFSELVRHRPTLSRNNSTEDNKFAFLQRSAFSSGNNSVERPTSQTFYTNADTNHRDDDGDDDVAAMARAMLNAGIEEDEDDSFYPPSSTKMKSSNGRSRRLPQPPPQQFVNLSRWGAFAPSN